VDPELPFGRADSPEVQAFIAGYCHKCPVTEQCLVMALQAEATCPSALGRHGVFGGLTGAERSKLVKRGLRECVSCRRLFVPHNRYHRLCGRHMRSGAVRDEDSREHGTEAGYGQHKRRGEDPCLPCRLGRNAAESARRRVPVGAA
jgi:hypothetical protein